MKRKRLTLQHVLFAAAFLLALFVRAAGVGHSVSTDSEAALALQAWEVFRGSDLMLLPHTAYLILTAPLMFLFGSLDWTARFWPVIAGSLLVLTPMLFQRWIGSLPAVLLAFFLALDPGMVAISLQAGSLSLALLMVVLVFGFWMNGMAAPAGAALGFALLSGPSIWPGFLGIGIAYLLASRLFWSKPDAVEPDSIVQPASPDIKQALKYALITFFAAGTLFFLMPRGLSAAASSLPAYLGGWLEPSSVPLLRLVVALLLSQFFVLTFGLAGGILGWLRADRTDQFLLTWFIVSLLLALINPGRLVTDLAWSILPLAALAARQVARLLTVPVYDRMATIGQTLLTLLILGYLSMTLISFTSRGVEASTQEYSLRLAASAVMLIGSAVLIGWGWSRQVALRGLAWGTALILLIYTVSAAWNSAGFSGLQAGLWFGEQRLTEADLLTNTIDLMDQRAGPESVGSDMVVAGIDSPVLRWSLRDREDVLYVNYLSSDANPAIVITGNDPAVELGAEYRGQSFTLKENTNWDQIRPLEWFRWLVFDTLPAERTFRDQIILWARTDLFPGGELAGQPLQDTDVPQDEVGPQ